MNPKISVIIPVYKTEEYLAECLNSVISQTLKEIEIIIVNDASPDNSVQIIKEFHQKDTRIVFINKTTNEGVGKARNDGIDIAKGEFICFMDSDDLYSTNTVLEKLYRAAKNNQVNVACGRKENLNGDCSIEILENPIIDNTITFYQMGLTKYSDFQYDYGYQCYIFNRKMIVEDDIRFPYYSRFQDPPFFVKAMFTAKEFYFIDEPVYRYRLISSPSKYTINKTIDMLDGIMDNLRFSRENGLAKLHCLSAFRLNTEGSFMAIQNLYSEGNDLLLAKLIEANQTVDVKWLKENSFQIKEPFVLDVFKHAVETAGKYEKLRNKKIVKPIRKILGR